MDNIEKKSLHNICDKANMLRYLKIFLVTVGIHWVIMGLAYILFYKLGGTTKDLFSYFYEKYNVCGDTEHYINIAKNGYYSSGEYANLIVFYPLYPLLIRIVSFIVPNYFIAGVLISNVCLGVSGCYLYRLVNKELGADKAVDSLMIYLVYPFGVFTVTVFTESLFLMLALMCLTYIKEEKWFAVGITGLLAALSRSQGIALLVPAVYEAILYMKRQKKFKFNCLWVLQIPCGTFIYLLINQIVQGDWRAFVEHQKAEPWYNTSHWISDNLVQHFNSAIDYSYLSWLIYWVQIILYFVGIVALVYGLYKGVSKSLIAFGGAYIFLSYLHGWLISGPRYMMCCVTLYIVYASIDNRRIKGAILALCSVLAVFYTLLSIQGHAIM
ncbi:MAG: hypothetical protein E7265_08970 [Lachnospiraceae bacterium]|nr:hypothetical protein [Lachnospiraceae bacterium]